MRQQRWMRIIAMVLIAAIIAIPSGMAFADAGGFSGGSDYSSGGSSYSGSSSSSSDDGLAELIFWLIMLAFEDGHLGGGEIAIIVIAVIAFIAIRFFFGGGGSGGLSGSSSKKKSPVKINDGFDSSKLKPISSLIEADPAFAVSAMQEKIANWYVQMQNAWTDKDFEPMRPHFTDALFAQFDRQLDSLRRTGQTNYVDRIAVLGVDIDGWYEDSGEECLVAKVRTRIVDYTMDESGNVVSGSMNAEKFMTYRWILTRTAGTQTTNEEGMTTVNCPNCAATLNVNKTGRCPYCDSIITVDEHDWVISAIQGLEQITA